MAQYKGLNKDESGNILLPIAANSAPVETTLTASQAYAVGEYFQYSNNLYQVTSAIASGGTITIGTNCTLVPSLGAEIAKLNSSLADSMGGTSDKFQFTTDGNGNYGYVKKVSGADTFFPFSGKIKAYIVRNGQECFYENTDGSYGISTYNNLAANSDIISQLSAISGYHYFYLEKDGYYIGNFEGMTLPAAYYSAGSYVRHSGSTQSIMYLGETNPYQ